MRSIMALWIAAASLTSAAEGPADPAPIPPSADPYKSGARALWVCTETLQNPAEIERLVATAAAYDIDTLFVQVRRAGDAYYFSAAEPRSRKLEGQSPDFDPLATVLANARPFGIQVHAWLNVVYCWPGPELPPMKSHVAARHPEWITVGRDSRRLTSYSKKEMARGDTEGWYIEPSEPAFAPYFAAVAREVAERYDVDGVHLDFIRYPNIRFGYGERARAAYRKARPAEPDPLLLGYHKADRDIFRPAAGATALAERWSDLHSLEWYEWRARQIEKIVAATGKAVHEAKPACIFSAAVWANPEHSYRYVGQDWLGWSERGLVDIMIPMTYWGDADKIGGVAKRLARRRADTCRIYMGIGTFNHDAAYTAATAAGLDGCPAEGFVLFDYDSCWRKPSTLPYLEREYPRPTAPAYP